MVTTLTKVFLILSLVLSLVLVLFCIPVFIYCSVIWVPIVLVVLAFVSMISIVVSISLLPHKASSKTFASPLPSEHITFV